MTTSRRRFLGTTSLGLLGVVVGGGAAPKPAEFRWPTTPVAHRGIGMEQRQPNTLLSSTLPHHCRPNWTGNGSGDVENKAINLSFRAS